MFLPILLGIFVVSSIFALKSMRAVDRHALMMNAMVMTGVFRLIPFLKLRPTVSEHTVSNGMKIGVPQYIFCVTLEVILKFETRKDDVFVAAYPKAGTTWMQEIVWLICNNADTNAAKKSSVTARYGFIEMVDFGNARGLQSLERWPTSSQRMIKTHLPFQLLPMEVQAEGKCKVIYIARNAKDVCVSYYHFHRMNSGMPVPGSWSKFLTKFCSAKLGYGSWFDHNLKYWEKFQENRGQIYFVTYEDLKKNLRAELVPLAKFLEKDLSNEQFDAIAEHCTFASMSENKSTNYSDMQKHGLDFKIAKFMRKGEVGDWKNHFTINESSLLDEMYKEKMKGTGLQMKFELDLVEQDKNKSN